MKTEILSDNAESIARTSKILSEGGLVALPTETVYGLAGNAFDAGVVKKIFAAKERPSFDPLIVHVGSKCTKADPLEFLVKEKILSPEILEWSSRSLISDAMKKFWPGPLTFVLVKGENISGAVTSNQNTVGIRCPNHPAFLAVLDSVPFPLAAPSANRFGRISPTTAKHVSDELNGRIEAILDGGNCIIGVESTILQIEEPLKLSILRPGKISIEQIHEHFKSEVHFTKAMGQATQSQLAPGMLDQHYAPEKKLLLLPHPYSETQKTLEFLNRHRVSGKIGFIGMTDIPPQIVRFAAEARVLSNTNSADEMARKLFGTLRELDADIMLDLLICDLPENSVSGLGAAIKDRLNRASFNKPIK